MCRNICNATHVAIIFNIVEVLVCLGRGCLVRLSRFGVSARHDIGASPPRINNWPDKYVGLLWSGLCAGLSFPPVNNNCCKPVNKRGLPGVWNLVVAVYRGIFCMVWRYMPSYGRSTSCWFPNAPVVRQFLFSPACTSLYTRSSVLNIKTCLCFLVLDSVTVKLYGQVTVRPVRLGSSTTDSV